MIVKVEVIKAYKTSDDITFEKYEDAIKHERQLRLKAILGNEGGGLPAGRGEWDLDMIIDAILRQRSAIVETLNPTTAETEETEEKYES